MVIGIYADVLCAGKANAVFDGPMVMEQLLTRLESPRSQLLELPCNGYIYLFPLNGGVAGQLLPPPIRSA
jgi:hypothetical protein